jgi:hypothetical protein
MATDEKRESILSFFHRCLSVFIGGFILIGCMPKNPPPQPAYTGPTESMEEVVRAINANNSKLPSLWATIASSGMDASIVDDKGKRHDYVLGGTLLYRAPGDVKLTGKHDLAGEVFAIGSNRDFYWLSTKEPETETLWGRYKYLGAECAQPIPIRPDLVLAVLGVSTVSPDFLTEPAPVMRFNNKADAYMFIWSARVPAGMPERWAAVKEVWYDRQTKRPKVVVLFDPSGRVVIEAHLAEHVPVKVPDMPRENWPTVASRYDLVFPDSGSRLRLKLADVALSNKGAPNDVTFRFAPPKAGKVTQLDEACGP